MAQPGLTVQLSPNSTELLNSECATSQTAETLFFLSSQSPKATQGVPWQQQAGDQRSSAPSALHSNTHHPTRATLRGGRAPPSGTALGNCGSTGHTTPTWTKRQRKAPLQIHEKAPGTAVSQAGTRFKAAVEVVQWFTILTSPLMQGVGVSQLQERWHREGSHRPLGSGLPWQLCSPAPQPDPS